MSDNNNSIITNNNNNNNEGENNMSTTCNAVKKDGQPCSNKAQDNGYCNISAHKNQAPVIVTEVPAIPNNKENNNMEIFHYLQALIGEDMSEESAIRMVTNYPSEALITAYRASAREMGAPKMVEGTTVQISAINHGKQDFHMLRNRAIAFGVKFRIASFPVGTINPDDVVKMAGRANFAYANSSRGVFVKFDGYDGWGLAPLGLNYRNTAKLVKRMNELLRLGSMSYYGPILCEEYSTPLGGEDIHYDGGNFISEAFARKLGFKGTRGNLRVITPGGLIKGDCIVVKSLGGADVRFHTENLKTELCSTDWFQATIMKHDPRHSLGYDDQSRGNFEFFLNYSMVQNDMARLVHEYRAAVAEGGELADYLDSMMDIEGERDDEEIQLSDTLGLQAQKLRDYNVAPASFSNLTYTQLGAMVRRMEAAKVEGTQIYKRMFVPASNAFRGAVSTYEFCTQMGGMDFPYEDGTRTFFDPAVGLIIPGERFARTFDLHGGWDGDDSLCMYAIKVFCSDSVRLQEMIDLGLVDENINVPATADEAVLAGLAIRQPNGPGEYSIEAISPDLPWENYNEDKVQTYDLAEAPMAQQEVFATTEIGTIPTSVSYDKDYDREAAILSICAQADNPGVGTFVNVLIAWVSVFGANSVPSYLIGSTEDVVDVLEQTSDVAAFMAIKNSVNDMWLEFVEKVIEEGAQVDPILIVTRIPAKIGQGDDAIDIGDAIVAAKLLRNGTASSLQAWYRKAIKIIGELGRATANETRNNLDLAVKVRGLSFDRKMMGWADAWFRSSFGKLATLDREFGAQVTPQTNAVARRRVQVRRRLAMENLMTTLTADIINNPLNTDDCVLALYKYIVTPTEKFPSGNMDRIFVQPGIPGVKDIMDLFLDAIYAQDLVN